MSKTYKEIGHDFATSISALIKYATDENPELTPTDRAKLLAIMFHSLLGMCVTVAVAVRAPHENVENEYKKYNKTIADITMQIGTSVLHAVEQQIPNDTAAGGGK